MIDEKRFSKAPAKEATQNVIMENRRKLSISGVEDVDSFDEDEVVLFTEMGTLNIRGGDLHINKLSIESGEVTVEGDIASLAYSDDDRASRSQGILSRIFK